MIIRHKDIAKVLDLSISTAQTKLTQIKTAFKKERRHKLTIDEFCEYERIPKPYVLSILRPTK